MSSNLKSSAKNIELTPYEDLFQTDESRAERQREKIMEVPLTELHPFPQHPFKVVDDAELQEMVESIKMYGVLAPAIVCKREEGGYEIISGHRRRLACEIVGLTTMPVVVRDLTKEEAVIVMVDSNLQRVTILPSEKAFAYKMKLDAIKSQGKRTDLTSGQLVQKLSVEIVGEQSGESYKQVQRYIRLTELLHELLQMVDDKLIAFSPAIELSYLAKQEQTELLETMESEDCTPSLSQAQRLKKLSQEGKLNMDDIFTIMTEEKGNQKEQIKLYKEQIKSFFPKDYSDKQMQDTILKLLEEWQRKREKSRSQER